MKKYSPLYTIEEREDGWAVVNVLTGVVAMEDEKQLVGMSRDEANGFADELSIRDWNIATAL